ncbi:hypothetical protein GCM10027215_18560 [Nocardioides zeae]
MSAAAVTEVSGELPCGPADDGLDRPHWEGLREGRLLLQRCGRCRTWRWTPRLLCPGCRSFDVRWEDVEPRGRVFSWIRTHHPYLVELGPDAVPYTTVLVELPGAGGSRVLGRAAAGVDPARGFRIGEEVVGRIEDVPGAAWPLLRWAPVGTQQDVAA